MKSISQFSLSLLVVLATLVSAQAQASKHPQKKKKESPIGYGINLGNIQFYNSTFQFGLGPNIAYKLGESTAVGFMMKLDYYYIKYRDLGLKFSSFDLGPTVFTRWKPLWTMDGATPFLQGIFLQAEYERAFIARAKTDEFGNIILKGDRIEAERHGEDYLYLGIGASSGYPFSTFFSIHYNVIDKPELTRIPFNYRIGFTYNY
jgi:hypothetical protein